jgi:ribose transport system permease protein
MGFGMASMTDTAVTPTALPKRREWLRTAAGRYAVVAVLALLLVSFSILRPTSFATAGNLGAIVSSQATLLVLALAATIPLRAGDFDISIAATMALSGSVVAQLLLNGASLTVVLTAAVAVGITVGAFNALLVVAIGIDSFVATLATMTALGGLTYFVTDSAVLTGFPALVRGLATTRFLGLPTSVYYGWMVALALWYVFERTPVGRYLLFVGGSRDSARLAGISVGRVRTGAFLASAVLSALAGVLLVGSLGAMDPSVGPQYLLSPFAAAFLGATALHVGRFNALGTVVAVYLLAVGITGLQMLGTDFWVADVFNGAALIVAVIATRSATGLLRRRRS